MRQCRLENNSGLTDTDLDPEFGESRGPNRETGMNLRCQIFALSKDTDVCCVGLFRYLGLDKPSDFSISKALAKMNGDLKAFDTRLPVSNHKNLVSWLKPLKKISFQTIISIFRNAFEVD